MSAAPVTSVLLTADEIEALAAYRNHRQQVLEHLSVATPGEFQEHRPALNEQVGEELTVIAARELGRYLASLSGPGAESSAAG